MAKNRTADRSRDTLNEDPRSELDFERGDDRSGRVGDRRQPADLAEEFPVERVRQAGFTGGETGRGDVTADDMSPETLLHEERADEPEGLGGEAPADTDLREVDEDTIGSGHGKDEAELADEQPLAAEEAPASNAKRDRAVRGSRAGRKRSGAN